MGRRKMARTSEVADRAFQPMAGFTKIYRQQRPKSNLTFRMTREGGAHAGAVAWATPSFCLWQQFGEGMGQGIAPMGHWQCLG
jgi:hypothetical protein